MAWLAGRRVLLVVAAVLVVGLGWRVADRPLVLWAARRAVGADYRRAVAIPVEPLVEPPRSLAERTAAFLPESFVALAREQLDSALLDLRSGEFRYTTRDLAGGGLRRVVTALLLEPVEEATDEITLYLVSSGPETRAAVKVESLLFAVSFDPPRRVLAIPLPIREHRGAPWPELAAFALEDFLALARQTALDVRRAIDACEAEGWRVVGLSGYSLGGCLAAGVAGLHPDAFAGAELSLWGAGGDLDAMVRTSSHWLPAKLRQPSGMSRSRYERILAVLDPVSHAGHARVRSVHLAAGSNDAIMPVACSAALRDAYATAGIPAELSIDDGGHWRGPTLVELFQKLLPWPRRWQ